MLRTTLCLLLVGCAPGLTVGPECDPDQIDEVLFRAPSDIRDIADRMDLKCRADLQGPCRRDVLGCTTHIGSSPYLSDLRGEVWSRTDQRTYRILAHEMVHWIQWDDRDCFGSHEPECYDYDLEHYLKDGWIE